MTINQNGHMRQKKIQYPERYKNAKKDCEVEKTMNFLKKIEIFEKNINIINS